ncbi:MAG: hypothetical protein KDA86_06720 [Planctomycetaceae bacterium]|nr:hypothetical protein [Planctomycetaceae bacterium]
MSRWCRHPHEFEEYLGELEFRCEKKRGLKRLLTFILPNAIPVLFFALMISGVVILFLDIRGGWRNYQFWLVYIPSLIAIIQGYRWILRRKLPSELDVYEKGIRYGFRALRFEEIDYWYVGTPVSRVQRALPTITAVAQHSGAASTINELSRTNFTLHTKCDQEITVAGLGWLFDEEDSLRFMNRFTVEVAQVPHPG